MVAPVGRVARAVLERRQCRRGAAEFEHGRWSSTTAAAARRATAWRVASSARAEAAAVVVGAEAGVCRWVRRTTTSSPRTTTTTPSRKSAGPSGTARAPGVALVLDGAREEAVVLPAWRRRCASAQPNSTSRGDAAARKLGRGRSRGLHSRHNLMASTGTFGGRRLPRPRRDLLSPRGTVSHRSSRRADPGAGAAALRIESHRVARGGDARRRSARWGRPGQIALGAAHAVGRDGDRAEPPGGLVVVLDAPEEDRQFIDHYYNGSKVSSSFTIILIILNSFVSACTFLGRRP